MCVLLVSVAEFSIIVLDRLLLQYQLPLDLINAESLPGWMIVFQTIVQRPVPLVSGRL